MKRERAEGLSAERRVAAAANEEFIGIVNRGEERLAPSPRRLGS